MNILVVPFLILIYNSGTNYVVNTHEYKLVLLLTLYYILFIFSFFYLFNI